MNSRLDAANEKLKRAARRVTRLPSGKTTIAELVLAAIQFSLLEERLTKKETRR